MSASRTRASIFPTASSGVIGTSDAEILISLNPEHHHPTAQYVRQLRRELPARFPGVEFFFQPADIVSQILNFGLPAPVDIQVVGADMRGNYDIAQKNRKSVAPRFPAPPTCMCNR